MYQSKLIGVGKYIPERVVTSSELEEAMRFAELGVRKGTIKLLNGVEERHFAAEDENTSDLAAKAAKQAIEMAQIDSEEIELLIFASISQDFIEPATANAVQYKVGATRAKCFDVKNACKPSHIVGDRQRVYPLGKCEDGPDRLRRGDAQVHQDGVRVKG